MKISCFAAAVLVSAGLSNISAAAPGSEGASMRVPVLLELFTSEGCSSCPPADRLLELLDRNQSISGADLIVVSEHVDYWNRLGWADPYSSEIYSARQRSYADRLHLDSVYTPQLVVDGSAELVGSDRAKIAEAVSKAALRAKLPLSLTVVRGPSDSAKVSVTAPAGSSQGAADLYIVVASDHARSAVSAGENAGRQLSHVAVALSFEKLGSWNPSEALSRDTRIRILPDARAGGTRVIAFLQNHVTGRIIGVTQVRV